MDKKNYRRGVGMIIMNHEGRFWLGQRIGTDTWQFPQGGIDKGESVREAMYRELQEETGLEKEVVEIVSISKRWLVYHIPNLFQRNNKKFDGAMQKWYLLKLTGNDSNFNLNMCFYIISYYITNCCLDLNCICVIFDLIKYLFRSNFSLLILYIKL